MDTPVEQRYIDEVGKHGARWLRSRCAGWILAAISFAESVFAPILIDPFLIALILARRERWLYYTIIAIVFSVIGGVVAYFLGALFFDFIGTWVIGFYGLEDEFAAIHKRLDSNGFVFVLIGALTPIPYKLVALASGLAQINFMTFFFASVVGRILRLGLVGGATYIVGPHALPLIRKHLLQLAYVIGIILIVYFIVRLL
ncbi:MAG: VTT domain-containing protein [Candidatus Paceibacterota bacterium]